MLGWCTRFRPRNGLEMHLCTHHPPIHPPVKRSVWWPSLRTSGRAVGAPTSWWPRHRHIHGIYSAFKSLLPALIAYSLSSFLVRVAVQPQINCGLFISNLFKFKKRWKKFWTNFLIERATLLQTSPSISTTVPCRSLRLLQSATLFQLQKPPTPCQTTAPRTTPIWTACDIFIIILLPWLCPWLLLFPDHKDFHAILFCEDTWILIAFALTASRDSLLSQCGETFWHCWVWSRNSKPKFKVNFNCQDFYLVDFFSGTGEKFFCAFCGCTK